MSGRPDISVIMPAWNREAYVGDAIRSVQRQDGVSFEIVVVDDGSTDGTRDVVEGLIRNDPRIRLLATDHPGVSAARNVGICDARGWYIAFLDSDDLMVRGRLAAQMALLAGRTDGAFASGEMIVAREIGADLEPVPGTPVKRDRVLSLTVLLLPRELFDRYGACDESLEFGEDVDLLFRLWEHGVPIVESTEPAIIYRRHDTNMTNDLLKTQRALAACLQRSPVRRRRDPSLRTDIPAYFLKRADPGRELA